MKESTFESKCMSHLHDPSYMEELLIHCCEGDIKAMQTLIKILTTIDKEQLPSPIQRLLQDNVELIIDSKEIFSNQLPWQELLHQLASLGIDSDLLRDILSRHCRQVYRDYPDPSGLIQAIGFLNPDKPIDQVYQNWQRFQYLQAPAWFWHPSLGFAHVVSIDGFTNELSIRDRSTQFKKISCLPLTTKLSELYAVLPNTFLESLLKNKETRSFIFMQEPASIDERIHASLYPRLEHSSLSILTESILIPDYLNPKEYKQWRLSRAFKENEQRTWKQSRTLMELRNALKNAKQINMNDGDYALLKPLFLRARKKEKDQDLLLESLVRLQQLSLEKDPDKIAYLLPEDSLLWKSKIFIASTGKLPYRLLASWFEFLLATQNSNWLINISMGLPLRCWTPLESTLLKNNRQLLDTVVDQIEASIKSGQATPDAIIWLWRRQGIKTPQLFAYPRSIFHILGKEATGNYLKAYKELYNFLLNDRDFQHALMQNGSRHGIEAFIKSIKQMPLLKATEQQSILVKILRYFPEAQDLVEERSKTVEKQMFSRLSSYRSAYKRQQELERILNQKIPENRAAIAHARSYGDLRENAEYKAAKDEQRFLLARRAELERDLANIELTDFSEINIQDSVIPGSTVELHYDNNKTESYHIMGIWDSIPEQFVLSYATPLGKALLGKQCGDSIKGPQGTATIRAIRPLPDEWMSWARENADTITID